MIKAYTETGSVYEFHMDALLVRRVNETGNFTDLRQDTQWIPMYAEPDIKVGAPIHIPLHPLGEGDITIRQTSYVTKVEEVEDDD